MIDDLTRRVVTNQISAEAAAVVHDAERLAQAYSQLAQDVAAGRTLSGEAYRLTQTATEILRRAARLDGLRETAKVAGLIAPAAPDTEK
ncbi:hypothetical protein [Streptomyces olivaceus]|uniref:hypothetical protein n=1 Tax=Streptomyces olivaceus TaxID=47716 RepID=UPI0004CC176A|nr:hypothetical protein [Streptomyces olivaceus]MBZ6102712.1 hypothetical protein [Streptomyces olivaceus]